MVNIAGWLGRAAVPVGERVCKPVDSGAGEQLIESGWAALQQH